MRYDYDSILNHPDLIEIINSCTTFADIMRAFNLPVRGKMGVTLKKKLLEKGYDLSHLTGILNIELDGKQWKKDYVKDLPFKVVN